MCVWNVSTSVSADYILYIVDRYYAYNINIINIIIYPYENNQCCLLSAIGIDHKYEL